MKVALALAGLILLAGCGDNAAEGATNKGTLPGNFEVGTVKVGDREVTCITMKRGASQTSWGGLSCDWENAR